MRCSIVGPEPAGRSVSLLEWFLSQPRHSKVAGYSDHYWNGVTTLALAKVIEGIVLYDQDLDLPSLHHLVPSGAVSKASLLGLFKEHFGHEAEIEPRATSGIDRTLGTSQRELNNRLWALAGYDVPPTIEEMVAELARWVRSGGYPFRKEVSA
jgi:dTDP-4-dehydrorhamnose reductase